MKVKDLEPLLPRYSDNSGFDVQIIYNTDKRGLAWCKYELYRPEENPKQRNLTVIGIRAGVLRFGGNYDDDLTLIVEETK